MMEDSLMTNRLRSRIGRLEQDPHNQRTIVLSVDYAERDRDDLVSEALAAAGIVRGPNDLLIKTLSFFTKPGDPLVRLISASSAPGGH